MSIRKNVLRSLLIVLLLAGRGGAQAQQGSTPLPADLIITVPQSPDLPWQNQSLNRLVRVDADTLEMTPFYTDDVALEINALAWSPQGDKLAIYRMYPSTNGYAYPRELCVISAGGVLLSCMQDRPSLVSTYSNERYDYRVIWSADGQTIVFTADREIEGDNRERVLVEADVNTGQTLRTLYSSPYNWGGNDPNAFAWTSTLDTVLVGVGPSSNDPFLVDLETGVETHINSFVPEHQQLAAICAQFSPDNAYFAAILVYNLDEYNPWGIDFGAMHKLYHLVIFNQAGQIQASLGEPNNGELIQMSECPTWLPNEQSFYTLGWWDNLEQETTSVSIFQYVLATQQLTEYRPISNAIVSPLMLAPDDRTFAYDTPFYPNPLKVVTILFPDGSVSFFKEYDYSAFPLWVAPTSPVDTDG